MNFIRTELGYFLPVTSELGLIELKWQRGSFPTDLIFPNLNPDVSRETTKQISLYLSGTLKKFSIPIDLSCWTNEMVVWFSLLSQIPYGVTISYEELARRWGNKKASRAAGQACKRNPIPLIIPCHRIINKDKNIKHYSGGEFNHSDFEENIQRKQWLINFEKENF